VDAVLNCGSGTVGAVDEDDELVMLDDGGGAEGGKREVAELAADRGVEGSLSVISLCMWACISRMVTMSWLSICSWLYAAAMRDESLLVDEAWLGGCDCCLLGAAGWRALVR